MKQTIGKVIGGIVFVAAVIVYLVSGGNDISESQSNTYQNSTSTKSVQDTSKADETDEKRTLEEIESVNSINSTNKEDKQEFAKNVSKYKFRKPSYLTEHYNKHGLEMGFDSEDAYLAAANAVINNPDALQKNEAEDNDRVFFIEETNEIVFLSGDGYIRTYFKCSGKAYFDRQ